MKVLSQEVWCGVGVLHESYYDTAMIQLKRNKSHHFYIECNHCKHNAMVPVTSLLNHYGDNITSDEVLKRARCTKCGFQGNNQMRLVYVGKSSLAQTGSAVNQKSHKDVEVYW
jgi:DNA-directed RNA polymerase subunit RPC12/RpoP